MVGLGTITGMRTGSRRRLAGGFTLIELLVVIAIIAILAAILFPVFARAREKARSTRCVANLKQLGNALSMYMDDYDGLYPWAVDFGDKNLPQIWDSFPYWQAWIAYMPLLPPTLDAYIKNRELWHCPSDRGFDIMEDTGLSLPTHPSAFQVHGTSYFYRTELTFTQSTVESLSDPSRVNVMFDSCGDFHGEGTNERGRWNVLYADGHVKTATHAQYHEAWDVDL